MGCIGIGWWSDVLADAIQRSGKLEIGSCYTRPEEKRKNFAAKYRCRSAASYEAMLADTEIEAIINTTPNHVHLVRTAREAWVNYEMSVWAGLFASKGVAPEVIARFADALDKALHEPVVRERLAQFGGSIQAKAERNPAAFDRFVRSEIAPGRPFLRRPRRINEAMGARDIPA